MTVYKFAPSSSEAVRQLNQLITSNVKQLLQGVQLETNISNAGVVELLDLYNGKRTQLLLQFTTPFMTRLSILAKNNAELQYNPLLGLPTPGLGVAAPSGKHKDGEQLYFDVMEFEDLAVLRVGDLPLYPMQQYRYADGKVRSAVHGHTTERSVQNLMNWKLNNQEQFIQTTDFMNAVKNIAALRHHPKKAAVAQKTVNGIMLEVMKELKEKNIPYQPTSPLLVCVKSLSKELGEDRFFGWCAPATFAGPGAWAVNFYSDGKGDTFMTDLVYPRESAMRAHTSLLPPQESYMPPRSFRFY